MNTAVLFDLHEGVATITLNQPERLNPLSRDVVDGLLQATARVRDDAAVRAVVLTGSGRGFCSGADLTDLGQRSASTVSLGAHVGELMETGGNRVISELHELPMPVLCAVNGAVAGGGCGLALAGDITIAARSAIFYLPFVPALGLVPDMGCSWVLPRVVGRSRALGLALLGDKLPAERAAQWGLIWACVDDAEFATQTAVLAARLAALPAHAVTEVRTLFACGEANTLSQQLALELAKQVTLIDGPCFAEGLAAFRGRRAAAFPPHRS